jgi:periplasmic divalent cation tolerance protein
LGDSWGENIKHRDRDGKGIKIMTYNLVYMTAANLEEARTIARALVESRLAACVNIIDNMNSVYRWEGEIHEDREVVIIAKTLNERVPELIRKVKSLHSYDCPCIAVIPIVGGNPDFLKWIEQETLGEGLLREISDDPLILN